MKNAFLLVGLVGLLFLAGCTTPGQNVNLSVYVVDQDGSPVQDAYVNVYANISISESTGIDWRNFSGTIQATGTTDADGRFKTEVPAGRYGIRVYKEDAYSGQVESLTETYESVTVTLGVDSNDDTTPPALSWNLPSSGMMELKVGDNFSLVADSNDLEGFGKISIKTAFTPLNGTQNPAQSRVVECAGLTSCTISQNFSSGVPGTFAVSVTATNAAGLSKTLTGSIQFSSGIGNLVSKTYSGILNSNPTSAHEQNLFLSSETFPRLQNKQVYATIGGLTQTQTIKEMYHIVANQKMDIINPNVKDLVQTVNAGDLNYSVTISPGIPTNFSDLGPSDFFPIYFLGQEYEVEKVTGNQVNIVRAGSEKIYKVNDLINAIGWDGQKYQVKFNSGINVSTGYAASVSLISNNGSILQTQQFTPNSSIIFRQNGSEVLRTKVYLKNISITTQNNQTVYLFSIYEGWNRIELVNGRPLEYNPSDANFSNWIVQLGAFGNNITYISVKNNQYSFNGSNPLYSVNSSFYPAGKKTKARFLDGTSFSGVVPEISFLGFDSNANETVSFIGGPNVASVVSASSYGAIKYKDAAGTTHSIPMAIRLANTTGLGSTFTFDSVSHAYATNGAANPTVFYLKRNSTDQNVMNNPDYQISLINGDFNLTANVVLLQGQNKTTYQYLVKRGVSGTNSVWLILAQQNMNVVKGRNLNFIGTSLNDANVSEKNTVSYYYPDVYDFNGQQSGTVTQVYRTAIFALTEQTSNKMIETGAGRALIYIDTEGGNAGTVDTANINKVGYTGKRTAVEYTAGSGRQNLMSLSEYLGQPNQASSNYSKAYTDYGTQFVLNNRNLSITLPNSGPDQTKLLVQEVSVQ